MVEDKDGNVTKMEVVGIEEKLGILRKAVPTLPIFLAIFLCLLNVFLPGIGKFAPNIYSPVPTTFCSSFT